MVEPGVENRLQLLFHFGVNAGKISLQRFVEITSTAPARIFGMYPKKGTIAAGSDADIVLWDPGAEHLISAADSSYALRLLDVRGVEGERQCSQCLLAWRADCGWR
ncbi:MAG: amidohydrolase family protein [Edaphobacter sp.]